MRIFYDGYIYRMQTVGGINRYFANIIDRLPPEAQPTLTAPYRSNKLQYPTHPNLKLQTFRGFRPHRISNKLSSYYFRAINARQKYDLAHPTYYEFLTQEKAPKKRQPTVLTVHDMIHELYADAIDPQGHTIEAKRRAIQSADAILCISESTKRDLLKYFPQVENRISITYLASEFKGEWSNSTDLVPTKPYFLYVGSRTKEYKNFGTLLTAISKARSINPDLELAVVGGQFNTLEQQLITTLKLENTVKLYQYPTDAHLAKLYRYSIAFVYPSLYEGFGIPPLEAMACGTPVVAANSSSIPEVVGDAGILFEPKAANDLADILLSLLDSPIQRDRLIQKGHDRRQLFNWDKTTAQTIEVYKSLL